MPIQNDSEDARELKRQSLTVLLAQCPKGEEQPTHESYLNAARRISPEVYARACEITFEQWEDRFTYPRPFHVRAAIREVLRDMAEKAFLNKRKRAEYDAMTPGQAVELLEALASKPAPDPANYVACAVRSLQEGILRRAAARRTDQPMLVEGGGDESSS